ncbi:integrase [Flavivirga aquatica]|uniref:Integrase n=3 Tax=Flavivirga aquatica TaxID=1849968 RepID=A0A1E5TAD9_9FLAO|nr:integrase [Flavivirga aquatica]
MCSIMNVSKNSYYTWVRTDNKQKDSLIYLKQRITGIYNDSNQVYGSLRVQKMLERENLFYSRSYIAFLMKELGLKSVLSKKYKVMTTNSNHDFPIAENILNRGFTSSQLGEKWVSDITYIKVGSGWNYLTTILDLADRKIVAWTLSADMTTKNMVYKAWVLAREKRKITNNHIFHSDRGVQYASNKMVSLLNLSSKITQSMSRKGNCWDNAVSESFFKTIKYECTNRYNFKSYLHTYHIINQYINWYNNSRIHSALDYKTPAEKELELRIINNKKVA